MGECQFQNCEEEIWTKSEDDYCIFHDPQAHKKDSGKFQKLIDEKIEKKDYNFHGYVFPKDIDFSDVVFQETANFLGVIFEGRVIFKNSEFQKNCTFYLAQFRGEAIFEKVEFNGKSIFEMANFSLYSNFKESIFKKEAFFEEATFSFETEFKRAKFYSKTDFDGCAFYRVNFSGAIFKDKTRFEDCQFFDETRFWDTVFETDVTFRFASFEEYTTYKGTDFYSKANFQWVDFQRVIFDESHIVMGIFHGADLTHASFIDTVFDNIYLSEAKLPIDSKEGRKEIKKIKGIGGEKTEIQPKEQEFCKLKNALQQEGFYDKAGEIYYFEKLINRWILFKETLIFQRFYLLLYHRKLRFDKISKFGFKTDIKNDFRWLGSLLLSALCGYGEKAWRVIASSLIIIFGFGLTYFAFGLTNLNPSATYTFETFWRCIYFSVVTFTTLGYGNIYPIGVGETLAMIQSFIGAFMIALFVLVVGRKFIR